MAAILGYDQYACVNFLNSRIECDNYRGIQISQHNRFDFEIIYAIIEEIYNIVGLDQIQIRTTDISKRPENIVGEELYATLVINIANRVGRCTQDSLRKNLFVDMHRMGLIERYDNAGLPTNPYKQARIKYISLTPLAERLLNTSDIFERRMIYTVALESLMSGYGESIANVMVELEMTSISEVEMSLFTSFIGQSLDGKTYSISDIASLLKEFRLMSIYQRENILCQIRDYCDRTMWEENKKDKRDWHNWLNESQQITHLLGQTAFFEHSETGLELRLTEDGVYGEGRLKRSKIEREKYYTNHCVEKRVGFELHHIVPLCWAKNREQFKVLDDWKNLVYIDAYSHAKITQNRNKNVVLNFEEHNVVFF